MPLSVRWSHAWRSHAVRVHRRKAVFEEHERAENAAVLEPVSFEAEAPDWYTPVRGRQRIPDHLFLVRPHLCVWLGVLLAPTAASLRVGDVLDHTRSDVKVITDPVSTSDGHVYERSAIEDWLKCAALLSPLTQIYTCSAHVHVC